MNVQTERIENHKARFTVEVPLADWEKAKRRAAQALAKRYKIPGFRKGKAPYRVISRYLGEETILNDAIEKLGNDVYRQALDESGVQPYTSGSLEDFSDDPPTYTFTVPLQPEVTLGEYYDVRLPYEAPEVDDDTLNRAMRQMQQREALVEESTQPITVGNRITLDIHGVYADDPPEVAETEEEEENDVASAPAAGDQFVHQHDAVVDLDPENGAILPGFMDAMVGANVDETLEFDLHAPEDDEEYADIAGRKIHFSVTVKKVEAVTMPELTDDFAARATADEEEPLSLLELRVRTREQLQEQATTQAEQTYSSEMLDQIVEGASIAYPQEMISDRVQEMLRDLDRELQQQGMNLEAYQQAMNVTHEDLHEQYEPEARRSLARTLVLSEIVQQENIPVSDDEVDAELEKMISQFGEQADLFRQYFDTPEQRASIGDNLLYQKVMKRLADIGRGLATAPDNNETQQEPVNGDAAENETQASAAADTTINDASDHDESASSVAGVDEKQPDDATPVKASDVDEADS